MPLVKAIEINNFRCIKHLLWYPSPGINCLVGPGDTGKTSVIDAIDYCLGARRSILLNDADFYKLDVDTPITITVTIGDLDDALKNIESYGLYVRGFNPKTGEIQPEPESSSETVLTIQLKVESDLEPQWTLVSERAAAQGLSRSLAWADRIRLAPTRIGATSENHLGWRRNSLLHKLTEEKVDVSAALTAAGRQARIAYGTKANEQLKSTLEIVSKAAGELGVPVGASVNALLDAGSLSFSGGMVSLHNEIGIPLAGLGLGSTRLLIAGLQRQAAAQASIILIDEVEHGLEPHRIIRFLSALGAKENPEPLQVFMTTHSPVAVRELSAYQLFILRSEGDEHSARFVAAEDDVQGTIRKFPEALLATSVMVCEGASEVGLLRGLDQYRTENGEKSLTACGLALVDGGGDTLFKRALAIQSLGYRTAVLRDSDKLPTPDLEEAFIASGGKVFAWRDGRALEDELFLSLSDEGVIALLDHAVDLKGDTLINDQIKSASKNTTDLARIQAEPFVDDISIESRTILGKASRPKETKKCWFKSVSAMEDAGCSIIAPDLHQADRDFVTILDEIFTWISNGSR